MAFPMPEPRLHLLFPSVFEGAELARRRGWRLHRSRPWRWVDRSGQTVAWVTGLGPPCAAAVGSLPPSEDARRWVLAGLAGGLDPALEVGTVVVLAGHSLLGRSAGRALPPWKPGRGVTVDQAVLSVEGKAQLRQRTGAEVVDMETDLVAAEAERRGLSLLVVRSVSDTARDRVPSCMLAGVDPRTGGSRRVRFLFSWLGDWASWMPVARQVAQALRARKCLSDWLQAQGLGEG